MSLFNEFDDDSDEYAIVELDSDNGSVLRLVILNNI